MFRKALCKMVKKKKKQPATAMTLPGEGSLRGRPGPLLLSLAVVGLGHFWPNSNDDSSSETFPVSPAVSCVPPLALSSDASSHAYETTSVFFHSSSPSKSPKANLSKRKAGRSLMTLGNCGHSVRGLRAFRYCL